MGTPKALQQHRGDREPSRHSSTGEGKESSARAAGAAGTVCGCGSGTAVHTAEPTRPLPPERRSHGAGWAAWIWVSLELQRGTGVLRGEVDKWL